jgi:hypothetical protein
MAPLLLPIAPTAGAEDIADLLPTFFELGLPDTKGAKLVRARILDESSFGFGGSGAEYSWLLREHPDGTCEILLHGLHRRKVTRVPESPDEPVQHPGAAWIEDADLPSALRQAKEEIKQMPGGAGDADSPFHQHTFGSWLIFLAQADRAGQSKLARELAPLLLAKAGSPTGAIDGAISAMASAQVAEAGRRWSASGDLRAYIRDVERVAAAFPRGWRHRGQAQWLLDRLRSAPTTPPDLPPEAAAAAKWLLEMPNEEFSSLLDGLNWLIGDPSENRLARVLTERFGDRRKAIPILAALADDQRLTRSLAEPDLMEAFSHYRTPRSHPADSIVRPRELREAVGAWLAPLFGSKAAMEPFIPTPADVAAWWASAQKLSEKELALQVIEDIEDPYSEQFLPAFTVLVKAADAESMPKIDELFLDARVMTNNEDAMIALLRKYLAVRPGDDAAFVRSIKSNVAKAQEESMADFKSQLSEDRARLYEKQQKATLDRFDQLLASKPSENP